MNIHEGAGDRHATVVVIGAGQAAMSAGYHLPLRRFVSALAEPGDARTLTTYLGSDADQRPMNRSCGDEASARPLLCRQTADTPPRRKRGNTHE